MSLKFVTNTTLQSGCILNTLLRALALNGNVYLKMTVNFGYLKL